MDAKRITVRKIKETVNRIIQQCYAPSAVYRLQFNPSFQFNDAVEYVPYLRRLGVDALYCSPYFQTIPGSQHGYNITDPQTINSELGSSEDYNSFCSILEQNGLAQVIDIVPNHMGVLGNNNLLWQDLLENGPSSRYAHFFDVDWNPVTAKLKNKLLVPVLGDQFGNVLERQEIQLYYNDGEFFFQYWSRRFPLAPKTYPAILEYNLVRMEEQFEESDDLFLEYKSIITAFNNLPDRTEVVTEKVMERAREKEIAKQRLRALLERSTKLKQAVLGSLSQFNGQKGVADSFDMLENLLDQQCYRLAFWCVAGEEINYRRFFDINELAAIRMEDRDVFDYYHKRIFSLLTEGKVRGLRIDHSDGLYDPPGYFRTLQYRFLCEAVVRAFVVELGGVTDDETLLIERTVNGLDFKNKLPLYVVIEKILDRKEQLPEAWCVHGTVGYDFLNALNGLFIFRQHERNFDEIYARFTEQKVEYDELLYKKKRHFAKVHMAGEINTLGYRLYQISGRNRNYRDFTLNSLIAAIREVIACFPVYRTYISPDAFAVSERDAHYISIAVSKARVRNKTVGNDLYNFVQDVLQLKFGDEVAPGERRLYRDFVLKFQQITSPIMAKGAEDTAFYVSNRFISLNEVGSDPTYFGYSEHEFHRQNIERNRKWPNAFITTSTHDTKRSDDMRLRLNVLSEMPELWKKNIVRWSRLNKKYKTLVDGLLQPDRNTEYFLYQTLTGVWPDYEIDQEYYPRFVDRISAYMEKAVREAKTNTSWTEPNVEYEFAVRRFIERILDRRRKNYFLSYFDEFQRKVASYGKYNSLSALVLKIGSPGVPDFYQGGELWDYSLVDPDNRRPVDFNLRRHLLNRVEEFCLTEDKVVEKVAELFLEKRDSRIKIFTLAWGLRLRQEWRDLFVGGDYLPVEVEGAYAGNVVAFIRRKGEQAVLVAAARFFYLLLGQGDDLPLGGSVWQDTCLLLPAEFKQVEMVDIYTGQKCTPQLAGSVCRLDAATLFAVVSFAMLKMELDKEEATE